MMHGESDQLYKKRFSHKDHVSSTAWEAGLFLLISHISIGIHRGTHATLRDQAALEKNGAFTQKGKAPNGGATILSQEPC